MLRFETKIKLNIEFDAILKIILKACKMLHKRYLVAIFFVNIC